MIRLMTPCPSMIPLLQSQLVSCTFTFWHIVGYGHADDSMSILHLAVNLEGGELCIWHLGVCNDANNSMSIPYPALAIIVGKLCILPYWL